MGNLRIAFVFACLQSLISCLWSQEINSLSDLNSSERYLTLSRDRQLQQDVGWKYFARWMHEQSTKTDVYGNAPTPDIWLDALADFKRVKLKAIKHQRENIWSPIGPFSAPGPTDPRYISGTGRINTITFHPSDPLTMWIGGGQGGVWKSTNGAKSWIPIGDELPVMRISDIALNPNDPDEIYVSLGDYAYVGFGLSQNDRKRNFHFGLGVYKTTDGGQSWTPTGLMRDLQSEDLSLTRRVFINVSDDNLILAAGTRGVWRSKDRGEIFNQLDSRMYWDIEQDPNNENTLYASTAFINTIDSDIAAVWKSMDFGLNWYKLNTKIPEIDTVQRIEIGISPIDPNVIYLVAAKISGGLHGFYQSTDAGETWELRAETPNILHWFDGINPGGQGNYDLAILAHPNDVNKVHVSGVNHWITEDGGKTWNGASHWVASHGPSVHADHHFLAFNPLDSQYYLCHDGGVSRTKELIPGSWEQANMDENYQWPTKWEHLNDGLANFSFYRIGLSSDADVDVFAGAQDLGTFVKREDNWIYNLLGDGMECIINPENKKLIYGSSQFGNIFRSDNDTTITRIGANQPNWQDEFASWTTPYKLGPNNPSIVYVPASNVWMSKDNGDNFIRISDFENEFPITGFSVAESDTNVMYVGKRVWYSLDQPGQALRTLDGGNSWQDITSGIPDDLIINYIEVDDDDPRHVWLVFGSFGEGRKVFESVDAGENWKNISFNLPNLPANCIVHHDKAPDNPIYIGMDRGIYYKNDQMEEWMLYSLELPNVIVSELEIHEATGQIFAATFGRGIWKADLLQPAAVNVENEQLQASKLTVNPNPNRGTFFLEFKDTALGLYGIQIVDVMGREVYFGEIKMVSQHDKHKISRKLLSGIYYLRIKYGPAQRILKFLVAD